MPTNPPLITVTVGQEYDLQCLQNNDYLFSFSLNTANNLGLAQDNYVLTGVTLTFYLKAQASSPDGTAYSNNPAVVSPIIGDFNLTIPRAQLTNPGTLFYHIDGLNADTTVDTLLFGNIYVVPI